MAEPQYEDAFLNALRKLGASSALSPAGETTHVADPGGVTLANLWRHPDTHPVVLDLLLLQKYGVEWMLWEPETLELHVPEDFKTQALSDLNMAKIQACKTLHMVDTFWKQWEIFLPLTMVFNGEFPDFELMQVPTVAQCMVSVDVANRLRDDMSWSDEMKLVLASVCQYDGVLLPIPPLEFVSVDYADLPVNMFDVRSRWPAVRAAGVATGHETPEDEQLRRLLIANDYLEASRARLRQQLKMVHDAQT